MPQLIERRAILRGLFAMPAIVAASSLMPIRGVIVPAPGPIHLTWEPVFRYEYNAESTTASNFMSIEIPSLAPEEMTGAQPPKGGFRKALKGRHDR